MPTGTVNAWLRSPCLIPRQRYSAIASLQNRLTMVNDTRANRLRQLAAVLALWRSDFVG